jgi:hypothetical protein
MPPSLAAAKGTNDVVRRSILVTLVVAVAVAWTSVAQAATAPTGLHLASAPYVSPAVLAWTPGADLLNVSQTVYRAPGACTSPLTAGAAVRTYPGNATAQHFAVPGDGTFCFSVTASDLAGGTASSSGVTATIDTTPPTATVAVSGQAPVGVVKGTVQVTGTGTDAVSGVATSVLRVGPVGACATGTVVTAAWNTTRYTDGSYDVCNTVTDRAGYSTTAALRVTVANAVPAPVPVAQGGVTPPADDQGTPAPAPAPAPGAGTSGSPAQDKDAPRAPSKLAVVQPRSKKGSTALIPLTLRWVNPAATDLERVVVILNLKHAPRGVNDGSVLYNGLRTSTAFTLRAGKSGYVALFAFDRSGNVSAPARRTVSLASLIPLRPLTGSRVTTAPRMTWKAQEGIAYYNVQVYRNGKRILVGWPAHASLRLPAYLLEPGIYTWYVWPAFKHANAAATFGDLIGRATFVYEK